MSVRHYVLFSTDGFINLPTNSEICPDLEDLTPIYVFGFVGGLFKVDNKIINPRLNWQNPQNWAKYKCLKGTATIPSPMIFGEVDDDIFITLINLGMRHRLDLTDFHTVHIHGAHVATQIDGFPETSFGVPMWEKTKECPPVATYYFKPMHSGTYMYHCHVEASEHIQMGMYGSLVIYPSMKSLNEAGIRKNKSGKWYFNGRLQRHIPSTATNRNFAYENVCTYFDKEYVMLLSDIDSTWHNSVLTDSDFNPVDYNPDYWLVNGRAFPDTLYPHQLTSSESNSDTGELNYESYVHVKTGEKFLLRMINMGYQVVPWHIHGWHFMVAGKDANINQFLKLNALLNIKEAKDELHEMGFTASIAAGETYDLIISTDDKRGEYKNYIDKGFPGIPYLCSQLKSLWQDDPSSIFDIPTEPVKCPNPTFINYLQICAQGRDDPNDNFFPQFYPMHNHDDYKVTNNGVYPGGQLTFIQVDAPDKVTEVTNKKKNRDEYEEDDFWFS